MVAQIKKDQIKIPEKIIKELKRIKNVKGYLLTGSRVFGKTAKNSDWDFFVLLKNDAPRWRKTWLVGGEWLEIFCNDEKQIKEYFKNEKENGRGVTLFMFATGKIIQDDKMGILYKLQMQAKKQWRNGPIPLSKRGRQRIDYDIATTIQDLEDLQHDNNPDIFLINNAMDDFVKYYYRLSRIWLPRRKGYFRDFSRRERKMATLIQKVMNTSIWLEKSSITIQLGRQIGKKFKLSLNGRIHLLSDRK